MPDTISPIEISTGRARGKVGSHQLSKRVGESVRNLCLTRPSGMIFGVDILRTPGCVPSDSAVVISHAGAAAQSRTVRSLISVKFLACSGCRYVYEHVHMLHVNTHAHIYMHAYTYL